MSGGHSEPVSRPAGVASLLGAAAARRRAPHVPVRTCAGCGGRAAQATLRRLGLAPGADGLEWREQGGRGTYLHDAAECRRRFVLGKKRLPGLRASVGRAARQALVDRLAVAR